MLIIVSRDHPGFYQSLKPAQETNGRDRVILDRRVADRRRTSMAVPLLERRKQQRRARVSDAERALMSVLGFTVLQREGRAATAKLARAPVRKAGPRARAADSGRERGTTRPLRRAAG